MKLFSALYQGTPDILCKFTNYGVIKVRVLFPIKHCVDCRVVSSIENIRLAWLIDWLDVEIFLSCSKTKLCEYIVSVPKMLSYKKGKQK